MFQLGRLGGGRCVWAVLRHVSGGPPTRRAVWGAAPDTPAMGNCPLEPQNDVISWMDVKCGWLSADRCRII